MKKNISYILCLMALPAWMGACQLHEEPELTANGELGVDPTEVTVNAQLSLSLTLSEGEGGTSRIPADEGYLHRFIIDAYQGDAYIRQAVVYEDIVEGRTHVSIPVEMKLHARDYRIAVWADYVQAADTITDWWYNTTTLSPVIKSDLTYKGNIEYKDVFCGMQRVNLSDYRDEWNAVVPIEMTLERPVGRYELIATDVQEFRDKIAAGEIAEGSTLTARINYSDYQPVGIDVLTGELRNPLSYLSYETPIRLPEEGIDDLNIGFDYVFCEAEGSEIPLEVTIVAEYGDEQTTIARSIIRIPAERGMNVTMRDNFLTADPALAEDGVGIDSSYDDEVDLEVDII